MKKLLFLSLAIIGLFSFSTASAQFFKDGVYVQAGTSTLLQEKPLFSQELELGYYVGKRTIHNIAVIGETSKESYRSWAVGLKYGAVLPVSPVVGITVGAEAKKDVTEYSAGDITLEQQLGLSFNLGSYVSLQTGLGLQAYEGQRFKRIYPEANFGLSVRLF